jgi:hypothetical protein
MAVVITNRHEPEGEVAARLLELASEKGYDARTVEAVRGEHDAGLSFRVPQDVADAFDGERADRWPDKIENDGEKASDLPSASVGEDAYAADQARAAAAQASLNQQQSNDAEQNAPAASRTRQGKAKE